MIMEERLMKTKVGEIRLHQLLVMRKDEVE